MKTVYVFLAMLALIACENHPLKDFAYNLLLNANGKKMEEQCMGDNFKSYMETLKSYADSANTLGVMSACMSVYGDITANCGKDISAANETFAIIIEKIKSPSFISELVAKGYGTLDILVKEHANKDKNATTIGTAIGEAINYLFQTKKSLNLRHHKLMKIAFLVGDDDLIWQLVEGFTTGLSQEGSQFLCRDTCLNNKEKLEALVLKVIELFKEGRSIAEIIAAVLTDIMAIPGFLGNCRILEFVAVITKATTEEGITEILQRISDGIPQILEYVAEAVLAGADKDFVKMTAALSKIVKLALDFYVL